MKAYIIEGKENGSVKSIATPIPSEDEVLIKVMTAGLCGTDGHIYQGHYYSTFPLIPGHEFSGVIAGVGRDVKHFKVGQRVAADPNIFCEKCSYCKQNVQNFCQDFEAVGVTRNGAFAEYVLVPEACVFDIGEMDFASAALIEPLACVVYGQERARPQVGDSVLIFGSGPIGLLHLQLARVNGASDITVVDLKEERLAIARELGAGHTVVAGPKMDEELRNLRPEGFNLVIDSTGVPSVVEKSLNYMGNAGTLLVFGVCPQDQKISISPYEIYKRDLKIVGSFALKKTFQPALNLINGGMIDVSRLIGERISLEQVPEYMNKLVAGRTRMKTVICPNGL